MNKANIKAAYLAACEGVVLLENEEMTLPLRKEKAVAFVGEGNFDYRKGGGGSANVVCGKILNLCEALCEKDINILDISKTQAKNYDAKLLDEWSESAKTAIVSIRRFSRESFDRTVSDFYLSEEETELFENIEKSGFESVVVVLNIGSAIDVATIKKYKKVKAILLIWQPGMEGARAVSDILCGDVTPSGKLTDTFAESYDAYPSSHDFDRDVYTVYYPEGIFVGYRYFETFAKDKVVYPFGYGLSYTTFDVSAVDVQTDSEKITVKVAVRNTGDFSGKEIVQIYSSSPEGKVKKPECELRAYEKTSLLAPGEAEELEISFKTSDMVYFDEETAEFVQDAGEYRIFFGQNVRDRVLCGTYVVQERTVTKKTTLKFSNEAPERMDENGKFVKTQSYDRRDHPPVNAEPDIGKDCTDLSLYDVSDGKITLDEFISALSVAQLIELGYGKPASVIRGTGGIGYMPKLGIPNPQTADGPAGIRRTVPTVNFPCETLLACTWNRDILYLIGEALGRECEENRSDILLAPGLNIHRDPLCGRNFEYYSEDPVVSGECAAAEVMGVQSVGIGATIKHFATNNRETNRKFCDSVVSERALREIYLKGFEIAIKKSNPWCVMTSYNKLCGEYSTENRRLIGGILRGEWGYEGLIMSDWWTMPHYCSELAAGTNVKMPYADPDEIRLTMVRYEAWNALDRKLLEKNAKYVLELIMKTKCFKNRNFGIVHNIEKDKENEISPELCCLASEESIGYNREEGFAYNLGRNKYGRDIFLGFRISCKESFEADICSVVAPAHPGIVIDVFIEGEKVSEIPCACDEYSLDNMFRTEKAKITLPEGEYEMRIYIRNSSEMNCLHMQKLIIG